MASYLSRAKHVCRAAHVLAVVWIVLHAGGECGAAESFTPTPYEPQRQVVELGRTGVFATAADIKDFRVADGNLCRAEVIGNDRKALAVYGIRRGSTTVTVWFSRPGTSPQTYIVDVATAPDSQRALEDFIRRQFPRSLITFTPVPTSTKVIVSGRAHSCYEWQGILQIIDGSGTRRSDLITRVHVPCGHCCPR